MLKDGNQSRFKTENLAKLWNNLKGIVLSYVNYTLLFWFSPL